MRMKRMMAIFPNLRNREREKRPSADLMRLRLVEG